MDNRGESFWLEARAPAFAKAGIADRGVHSSAKGPESLHVRSGPIHGAEPRHGESRAAIVASRFLGEIADDSPAGRDGGLGDDGSVAARAEKDEIALESWVHAGILSRHGVRRHLRRRANAFRLRPRPATVIPRHPNPRIDAPAGVADEALSGERKRRNVNDKQNDQGREQDRIRRDAQETDDRTGKREGNNEGCHLREHLASVQPIAATKDALAQMPAVVERPLPIEEAVHLSGAFARFRVRADLRLGTRLLALARVRGSGTFFAWRGSHRHSNEVGALLGVDLDAAKPSVAAGGLISQGALGGLAHVDAHDAMIREMSAPLDVVSLPRSTGSSPPIPVPTALPTVQNDRTTQPSLAHHSSTFPACLGGRFVVFDGPDGSGKSTQFRRFAEFCGARSVTVTEVREPGGTSIGEHIRAVLLDPANDSMAMRCEMLLYMASRAQLFEERIVPALGRGELVLADRFTSSTLAYQGTAGGLAFDDILAVGKVATGNRWPDLTVIFDVDERTAASRLSPLLDRIEQRGAEFHRRVRDGYLQQVRDFPDRYRVVDASKNPDEVFSELLGTVERFFVG
jgi:dTMP kinase